MRRPSSIAIFHMRSLQALDADLAGAPHRHIATALFGEDVTYLDWQPDGALRAQVRHLITRGRHHMYGGYRRLIESSKT